MEKLSPKESVKAADAVLRGGVRAPEGFSEGKPEAAKPRVRSPQCFAAEGLLMENSEGAFKCPAAQCRHLRHSPEGTVIPLGPKDFQQLLRLPKS